VTPHICRTTHSTCPTHTASLDRIEAPTCLPGVANLPTAAVQSSIPLSRPDLPPFEDINGPMREIFESGNLENFGMYVRRFEEEASAYLGAHVVTVSSATMGLVFTLQAVGVKPGQRVILPSFTSAATTQAIRYAGGVPTFAEIGPDLTLSPTDVEMLLAEHDDVAAVMPVHLHGLPCKVDEIHDVVNRAAKRRRRPIAVVYDSAHAFGSSVHGKPVGVFGTAEVFSISESKPLVSIQGGLVTSRSVGLIGRLRKMRNYGIEAGNDVYWPGLNGHMCELHALVGLHNLRRLPERLVERRLRARVYADRLTAATPVGLTAWPTSISPNFKSFVVVLPSDLSADRRRILSLLAERGVTAQAHCYPAVHEQPLFRAFADRPLPVTEDLSRRVISLPFFTTMSDAEMDHVVGALAEALAIARRLPEQAALLELAE
jgi:dTDP-4-amino-4,6-dideoxygalactose transaminase